MIVTLVLMLQAGPTALPRTIDLRTTAMPACKAEGDADAIVVCGRSDASERYRLRPLPDVEEAQLLPKAETNFAGGRISAEADAAILPGGQISKRAMVRYKLKF